MTSAEFQQLVRKYRYLPMKRAAEIHGVCEKTLRRKLGVPGGPPYRKRGRVYRFPTFEFLTWSEQTETP